jgi:hypothetical protein
MKMFPQACWGTREGTMTCNNVPPAVLKKHFTGNKKAIFVPDNVLERPCQIRG